MRVAMRWARVRLLPRSKSAPSPTLPRIAGEGAQCWRREGSGGTEAIGSRKRASKIRVMGSEPRGREDNERKRERGAGAVSSSAWLTIGFCLLLRFLYT